MRECYKNMFRDGMWAGAGIVMLTGILHASPTLCPPDCISEGRMTGGGVVRGLNEADGQQVAVVHEFELQCDVNRAPNDLEISWDNEQQQFYLESLGFAGCEDLDTIGPGQPHASFDTIVASGYGRLNNGSGAFIFVLFTDAGEPGKNDSSTIVIYDSDGNLVLNITENVRGNHQAHDQSESTTAVTPD